MPSTGTLPARLPLAAPLARVRARAIGIVVFALLTALAAQIIIPLPGTPVPITLQTLIVTLAPFALGASGGMAAMALYAALGLVGLPFFAGADGGWHVATGATMGYILGFVACQPIMALIAGDPSQRNATFVRAAIAMLAGHIVIFGLGLAWLAVWLSTNDQSSGVVRVLELGLLPFVVGSLVKGALATLIAPDLSLFAARRGL